MQIETLYIVIVVIILVFLALREINCWYWKINERVGLLKEQNLLLKRIFMQLGGEIIDSNDALSKTGYICPKCRSSYKTHFAK